MKIFVMNRKEAIEFCKHPHLAQFAMISIGTPHEDYKEVPFCNTTNNVVDICFVNFFDLDNTYPIKEGLMKHEDAKKIAKFVSQNRDKIIIVHCDAGQSRSAGVAAAISRYYNNYDFEYFDNPRYTPNMRCYHLMMNAMITYDLRREIEAEEKAEKESNI